MICFDCGKKKLKGIPVYILANGKIEKVCRLCWDLNYKKWMPRTKGPWIK